MIARKSLRVDAFVLSDGAVADGDGYALADSDHEQDAEDPAPLTREAKVAVAVVPQRIHRFCQVSDRRTMQC
jgi:hypothetical protein